MTMTKVTKAIRVAAELKSISRSDDREEEDDVRVVRDDDVVFVDDI